MKIWLLRASELMPVVDGQDRLLRMGMLGEELSKRNHNITWYASTFNHFKKKQVCDYDMIVQVRDNYILNLIHAVGYRKNISISRIINHKLIATKLRKKMKHADKPDIIYASFPTIEFADEAVKYGKKNNVPVIIDIRDLWPDNFKQNLHGVVKLLSTPYIWYLNRRTRKIMKNCYAITSITDKMLDWGLEKGSRTKTENDQSFYIGYIKNDDFADIKGSKKLLDKTKFNICFFGTINNQFNYDLIVDIAASLENENVEFIICGLGPNLEKFQEKATGVKNIRFVGWQDKKNLNYIFQHCQIGFAPYKDTFDFQMSVSNKFSEYLSYGLPILITSSGYMKEIIEKNDVGLSSTNVEEIKKFVLNLRDNKKEHKRLSNNALNLFQEQFDAKTIYSELADYLEMIDKEYKK